MVKIFKCFCAENDIIPEHRVLSMVKSHFAHEAAKKARNYGNARAVRNYFEKILLNQANRLVSNGTLDRDDLCSISVEDLPGNKILSEIDRKTPENNIFAFKG